MAELEVLGLMKEGHGLAPIMLLARLVVTLRRPSRRMTNGRGRPLHSTLVGKADSATEELSLRAREFTAEKLEGA